MRSSADRLVLLLSMLSACRAWSHGITPGDARQPNTLPHSQKFNTLPHSQKFHGVCAPLLLRSSCRQHRSTVPLCLDNGDDGNDAGLDFLGIYGDAGVLLAYGSVQTVFDLLVKPIAATGIFLPVPHAASQGIVLAALWCGMLLLLKEYSLSRTRTFRPFPLTATWLSSSLAMLAASTTIMGVPLEAELDFLVGAASVLGGWRYCLTTGAELP